MLKQLICLAYLSMFATSVAYAQENENKTAEEPQKAADFAALGQMLEALKNTAESQNKSLDDDDNNNTKTVTDNAPQSASESAISEMESVSESAKAEETVIEADPE